MLMLVIMVPSTCLSWCLILTVLLLPSTSRLLQLPVPTTSLLMVGMLVMLPMQPVLTLVMLPMQLVIMLLSSVIMLVILRLLLVIMPVILPMLLYQLIIMVVWLVTPMALWCPLTSLLWLLLALTTLLPRLPMDTEKWKTPSIRPLWIPIYKNAIDSLNANRINIHPSLSPSTLAFVSANIIVAFLFCYSHNTA